MLGNTLLSNHHQPAIGRTHEMTNTTTQARARARAPPIPTRQPNPSP